MPGLTQTLGALSYSSVIYATTSAVHMLLRVRERVQYMHADAANWQRRQILTPNKTPTSYGFFPTLSLLSDSSSI